MNNIEEPNSTNVRKKKLSPQIIVIIVLAALLIISIGALAARYIYLNFFDSSGATVTIEDNLIGDSDQDQQTDPGTDTDDNSDSDSGNDNQQTDSDSQQSGSDNHPSSGSGDQNNANASESDTEKPKATVLELYKGKPEDNEVFNVTNMLPGDSVTKYFCIKATHDLDFDLIFEAQITDQTKQLADALKIKVTLPETSAVLFDGTFAQADKQQLSVPVSKNDAGQTTIYYQIDVYLDTSAGNEYQASTLAADFVWSADDDESLAAPDTGDNINIILWIIILICSAAIILLLLLNHRKEEKNRE